MPVRALIQRGGCICPASFHLRCMHRTSVVEAAIHSHALIIAPVNFRATGLARSICRWSIQFSGTNFSRTSVGITPPCTTTWCRQEHCETEPAPCAVRATNNICRRVSLLCLSFSTALTCDYLSRPCHKPCARCSNGRLKDVLICCYPDAGSSWTSVVRR